MATDLRKLAQDTAYITVGAGVLAFQRAQVARREARARIEEQIRDTREQLQNTRQRLITTAEGARSTVTKSAEDVRARIAETTKDARSRIEPVADQVQGRLPEPFARAVETGRSRIQNLVGTAAGNGAIQS